MLTSNDEMPHLPHIPSKEEMIQAVRTSGCPRLRGIAYEHMTQSELYTALLLAKCPCLQRLMTEKEDR